MAADGQTAATGDDELLYEIVDGVGLITLNRPQARNALTIPMYDRLAEILGTVPIDGSVHAIIITGAGEKAFAAGTDITHFLDFSTPEQGYTYEGEAKKNFDVYESCPVPVIAAIAGACTGGGAAIAGCCDMRFATSTLKFGFPISRTLGNCLSLDTLARLSSLIGEAKTKDLIITSRLMLAEEAKAIGLVNDVFATHGELMDHVWAFARSLKEHAPLTMRATKMLLKRLREDGPGACDKDWVGKIYASADFKEGREAFLAKRKPVWTGT